MINLIYLCFKANPEEKKEIYKVLTSSEEITNFCQESVKSESSLKLNQKLKDSDLFKDKEIFFKKLILEKSESLLQKKELKSKEFETKSNYIKVLKIINNYFKN